MNRDQFWLTDAQFSKIEPGYGVTVTVVRQGKLWVTVTPISRPRVKARAIFWRRQPPLFLLHSFQQRHPEPRPFLRLVAATHDGSRQTPIRIKHGPTVPVALAAWPPQKNVGAAPRPIGFIRIPWLPMCRLQSPWLTLRAIRLHCKAGDGEPASNSVQLACAPVRLTWLAGSPSSFRQSSASRQTACPPSGCDSRPAPACAPAPWSQPPCLVLAFLRS